MPGIVLGFNDATNNFFSKLFLQINKTEPLINEDSIPHISLMRFENIEELPTISDKLGKLSFETFNVSINGISIYKKSDIKYVLVFDPIYDSNVSSIHNIIWDNLGDGIIKLKEPELYNPSTYSLHLTIDLNNPTKDNIHKVLDILMDLPRDPFPIKVNKIMVINNGNVEYQQLFDGIPLIYFNKEI